MVCAGIFCLVVFLVCCGGDGMLSFFRGMFGPYRISLIRLAIWQELSKQV